MEAAKATMKEQQNHLRAPHHQYGAEEVVEEEEELINQHHLTLIEMTMQHHWMKLLIRVFWVLQFKARKK